MQAAATDSRRLVIVQPINKPRPEQELPKWAKCTPVSLVIEKKDLTYEEWVGLIDQLKNREKRRQWIIGDALIHGERQFGEEASQVYDVEDDAEKEEEGSYETFRQYMQVADRIPPGSRLPELSWGHHQVVAYLPPQTRDELLLKARDEGWKRSDLRKVVRKFNRERDKRQRKERSESQPIQSEEAIAFFNNYIEALALIEEGIPKGLPSARMMNHGHRAHAQWQRDRTIDADCAAIVEMFRGEKGMPGVYRATDGEISVWLQKCGYFMSDPDLEARLELMVEKHMLDIVDREEARQVGRRGSMGDVYRINPEYLAQLEDDEDAA